MDKPKVKRPTTIRDKHRATIRKGRPDCHLCGTPIDYEAHWLSPFSFTVDHVLPLAKGGTDTLDNKAAAHRACNRAKSDKTDAVVLPPVTLKRLRVW